MRVTLTLWHKVRRKHLDLRLFSDSLQLLQLMKAWSTFQWTQLKKNRLGLQELANLSLKNTQVRGMNRLTLSDQSV
jgi:hypothetical protein